MAVLVEVPGIVTVKLACGNAFAVNESNLYVLIAGEGVSP